MTQPERYGPENGWFRRAIAAGPVACLECDVDFERPDDLSTEGVNAAYHAKYDHYDPSMVGRVVSPEAVQDDHQTPSSLVRLAVAP